jgi:hypothetical protein
MVCSTEPAEIHPAHPRNVEPRDTNIRKQTLQQRVVKLCGFFEIRNPGLRLSKRINV